MFSPALFLIMINGNQIIGDTEKSHYITILICIYIYVYLRSHLKSFDSLREFSL